MSRGKTSKKKLIVFPSECHLFLPQLMFLFFCVWDPDSCQRLVFFGRGEGMTSTGVVITMRTLLSPDYTGSGRGEKMWRKMGVAFLKNIWNISIWKCHHTWSGFTSKLSLEQKQMKPHYYGSGVSCESGSAHGENPSSTVHRKWLIGVELLAWVCALLKQGADSSGWLTLMLAFPCSKPSTDC